MNLKSSQKCSTAKLVVGLFLLIAGIIAFFVNQNYQERRFHKALGNIHLQCIAVLHKYESTSTVSFSEIIFVSDGGRFKNSWDSKLQSELTREGYAHFTNSLSSLEQAFNAQGHNAQIHSNMHQFVTEYNSCSSEIGELIAGRSRVWKTQKTTSPDSDRQAQATPAEPAIPKLTQEALDAAKAQFDDEWLSQGGTSWVSFRPDRVVAFYEELRNLTSEVTSLPISEADQLNGFEWHGRVAFIARTSRKANILFRGDTVWGPWQDGASIPYDLTKKSGTWALDKEGGSWRERVKPDLATVNRIKQSQ